MTRHSFLLTTGMLSLLVAGCAHPHLSDADKLPKNAEYLPAPTFDQFDPAQVTSDAKKLLGTTGPVSMITMNVKADENDLPQVMSTLRDVHSRGEAVVCVGRESRFVTDTLGRALMKNRKVDLSGMIIVVAAPNQPSPDFPEFLASRKIQYRYMHVKSGGPYGE